MEIQIETENCNMILIKKLGLLSSKIDKFEYLAG